MPPSSMELIDRELLNVIQTGFPLTGRPYREIGEQLGIDEAEVLDRIAALKKANVVRQISAIFDTRRLGYSSSLVAMRLREDEIEEAARIVNRHPGVSHNYGRDGYFNLWFTLAVPPGEDLDAVMERMAKETGALATRALPTIRFFKIGVNFDMVRGEGNAPESAVLPPPLVPDAASNDGSGASRPLTEADIAAIRELQEDLEVTPRPFDAMARRLGVSPEELFAHAEDFRERKLMRRFSAVLHHRRAGFSANAMAVWKVPPERAEEAGVLMAQSPAVTHCYQRPTFPDWEYSHFTMIHATSRAKCEEVARGISEATGITDYELLYSTREYKKTRVRYFV